MRALIRDTSQTTVPAVRAAAALLLLRRQNFSEGTFDSFPKEKERLYFIVLIGLNLFEMELETVKLRVRRV